ncbi:MAG: nicotinamide mononucleotide transporter family protein [Tepidibacter sp.]|jgi:nicotinamide mononucleotide transporter PnuC|uniref:nicotinamide mononucleotide transporter n=1 Tax=Tepidibacter sp. TaxID=2529387 RepID=UPI0025FAB7B0|nr:nicotinamide mononucleotide transporter [Tepidibacter sp.]MCT4508748.1 nicotinamide mononucleotide transporter family protein [Tepidibacter sp.]
MNIFFNTLSWILVIGSLVGGHLVINKKKEGYILWIVVNALWIIFYINKEIYSSMFLFSIYLFQSIYGYKKWANE